MREERRTAFGGRAARPLVEGLARGGDGGIDLRGAARGHLGDAIARRRIDNRVGRIAGGRHPRTSDVVRGAHG